MTVGLQIRVNGNTSDSQIRADTVELACQTVIKSPDKVRSKLKRENLKLFNLKLDLSFNQTAIYISEHFALYGSYRT